MHIDDMKYRVRLVATPRVGTADIPAVIREEQAVNGKITDLKRQLELDMHGNNFLGEMLPGIGFTYVTPDEEEALSMYRLCWQLVGHDLFSIGAAYLELAKIERIDGPFSDY